MKAFEYHSAPDLRSAFDMLARRVRPYAGGTDLLPLLNARIEDPECLVDIKRAGLPRGIVDSAAGVRIGALTPISELETHPLIERRFPLLQQAALQLATPQLRNRATLAGNLLQRPRCAYFRDESISCWLKGGATCPAESGRNELHAVFGGGPCHAVHPSDLAPCLRALDASVRVEGSHGLRTLPLEELYALPDADHRSETRLPPDELILDVDIPASLDATRSVYLKAMDRKVWAFALVGVAIVLEYDGARIESARIVLGGVAPIPWRARAAEQVLRGSAPEPALLARAADAALAGAAPLARNGYKLRLLQRLVARGLEELTRT